MKNLVIIGAGDLGKELVWLIEDINHVNPTYVILGFLDNDPEKVGKEFYGYKVLGTDEELDDLAKRTPVSAVIAIQDGDIRKKIVEKHITFKAWETIIHPTAVIAPTSSIGKGSIVFPQVTVSVDTKLGEFNLLYIHSTVCNDCKTSDFVSTMSETSISERVEVGERSYIAAGATVYPSTKIGKGVRVGVGASVSKDQPDGTVVMGATSRNAFFK